MTNASSSPAKCVEDMASTDKWTAITIAIPTIATAAVAYEFHLDKHNRTQHIDSE